MNPSGASGSRALGGSNFFNAAPVRPAGRDAPPDAVGARLPAMAWLLRLWVSPAVLVAILVAGCGLRVAQYSLNRSLWLDEARLAVNIVQRDAAGMLDPLDFRQAAPALFLLATKAVTQVAGLEERALRLLPLLAGVASLFLFYRVARQLLTEEAARLALLLLALSPPAVRYASEFKQYSFDLLATVAILLLALRIHRAAYALKPAIIAGLVGAVLVWCSHASIFVLAGVGVTLLAAVSTLSAGLRLRALVSLATCGALWLGSFAWSYFAVVQASQSDFFYRYWKEHLAPFPPQTVEELKWYPETFAQVVANPLGLMFPALMALLAVVGAFAFWRKEARVYLGLVALPLLFLGVASLAKAYPIADRLVLFTAPLFYVLIVAGLVAIARWRPVGGAMPALLLALLLFGPAKGDVKLFYRPEALEENRPVMAYYLKHRQAEEPTYVYYDAEPAFLYYTRDLPEPLPYHAGVKSREDPSAYTKELDGFAGRGRMWFFLSHPTGKEHSLIIKHLDQLGTRVRAFERAGAAVFLYDLNRPPASRPASAP